MRKNFPDGLLGRLELVALCEAGPGPHQQPLIDFLGEVFAKKTQVQWVEWFAGRDISFAPVKDLREALDDRSSSRAAWCCGMSAATCTWVFP
jgi:crotonobetainyl-CoA:carnitine CoA-transferase CaiB-like acyl-CoA transferase